LEKLEFIIHSITVGKDGKIYLCLHCPGSDSYPNFVFDYSDELLLELTKLKGKKLVVKS